MKPAPRKPKATVTVELTEEERDALVALLHVNYLYGDDPLVETAYLALRRARVAKRKGKP